jgi:kynureninase
MVALDAALDAFDGIDLADVRAKSLQLTQLVIDYADAYLPGATVVTPPDPERRGSQVSLAMPHAYEITQALIAANVIGDFRAPDMLRLGFAAPYLRFVDVWDAMETLRDVLAAGAWRAPEFARGDAAVT